MKPRRRKSKRYEWVQDLLWEWGDNEARLVSALGYPSISVEAQAIVDGRTHQLRAGLRGDYIKGLYIPRQTQKCKETRSHGPRTPDYWPDLRIVAVDRAVQRLSQDKQVAVKLRFLMNFTLETCAKNMDPVLTEREFRTLLDEIYSEIEPAIPKET